MQLPKKISPERIREAVVQLHFHSDIPYEPLIGYIYSVLSENGYSYTNRPVRPSHFLQQGTQALSGAIDIQLAPQHFFFNEQIRVQVQPGSLIFNCMDTYPGWEAYFTMIKNVVKKLVSNGSVSEFHRVGMRYISEFPNVDILESTHFTVDFGELEQPVTSGSFRVEWAKGNCRYIVNLAAKLPIEPLVVEIEGSAKFTSLIDLDVIRQDFKIETPDDLFSIIEEVHINEKELFFKLLKPEFLETLNPEY